MKLLVWDKHSSLSNLSVGFKEYKYHNINNMKVFFLRHASYLHIWINLINLFSILHNIYPLGIYFSCTYISSHTDVNAYFRPWIYFIKAWYYWIRPRPNAIKQTADYAANLDFLLRWVDFKNSFAIKFLLWNESKIKFMQSSDF
jgi:hypothetical protein